MSEALLIEAGPETFAEIEAGALAGKLAALLGSLPSAAVSPLSEARAFLESMARVDRARPSPDDPLSRLTAELPLSPLELDLVVLAGLPEHHEGYAGVLRHLHPRGESAPTVGLAAQLFCHNVGERRRLRETLASGRAVASGALAVAGEGAFPERSLVLADELWPVLCGIDAWPAALTRLPESAPVDGLEEWLHSAAAQNAAAAMRAGHASTVLVTADSEDVALHRAAALVSAAEVPSLSIALHPGRTEVEETLVGVHALARGLVPVVRIDQPDPPATASVPGFADYPAPLVVAARGGVEIASSERPFIPVPVAPLAHRARRRMWRALLPDLAEDAPQLAARYVVEPRVAAVAAGDVRTIAALERRAPTVGDVADSLRTRAAVSLAGGVRLVHPEATWSQLVLPTESRAQLKDALARLVHESVVLDDWRFLAGRPGARGVRMLFAGPPGTGKTLSAEVLATELGSELLVVDIARLVSKWIGETEKNLAEVFDVAERAHAVLFFDEADALFGRRTEVSDAHDRYANLETAYLLMRLERFESLAILATNMRSNVDPAFVRRLEFVVEFEEPSRDERRALWEVHLPPEAPVDDDVSLDDLAELYAVPGALIRNAAVAAAFLAADDGGSISHAHLVRAMRREYQKSGRAFPGRPAGTTA
jgi:hypothetical protein